MRVLIVPYEISIGLYAIVARFGVSDLNKALISFYRCKKCNNWLYRDIALSLSCIFV